MPAVALRGFAPELITFLRQLAANNERDWFQAHKDDYQRYYVDAAREFVVAMGELLPELGPDIHADPKVRGSIFAINRDIRFSPDKTPYKTYLDIWFWQGDGPSRERPGYFLRLDAERLTLGAGMHLFGDAALAVYRAALQNPQHAADLENAIKALPADATVGGKTLKRVPQGFAGADDELLKHTALYASTTLVSQKAIDCDLPDLCMQHYRGLAPLQQWLAAILPR